MSALLHKEVLERLNRRKHELLKREDALNKHLRGQDGRLDQDFSDRVAYTQMDDVLEKLDEQARAELREIDFAIQRLENGEYGECEECGESIAEKRLVLLPTTRRCVSCAD